MTELSPTAGQALLNLDGIIAKSGALMVARGDLGVEIGLERCVVQNADMGRQSAGESSSWFPELRSRAAQGPVVAEADGRKGQGGRVRKHTMVLASPSILNISPVRPARRFMVRSRVGRCQKSVILTFANHESDRRPNWAMHAPSTQHFQKYDSELFFGPNRAKGRIPK